MKYIHMIKTIRQKSEFWYVTFRWGKKKSKCFHSIFHVSSLHNLFYRDQYLQNFSYLFSPLRLRLIQTKSHLASMKSKNHVETNGRLKFIYMWISQVQCQHLQRLEWCIAIGKVSSVGREKIESFSFHNTINFLPYQLLDCCWLSIQCAILQIMTKEKKLKLGKTEKDCFHEKFN